MDQAEVVQIEVYALLRPSYLVGRPGTLFDSLDQLFLLLLIRGRNLADDVRLVQGVTGLRLGVFLVSQQS